MLQVALGARPAVQSVIDAQLTERVVGQRSEGFLRPDQA